MNAAICKSDLRELPNIGAETARLLIEAGIRSAEELRQMGAVAAAARIGAIRPDDPPCRSMLAGLEGAIRGVRWHIIPQEEREVLWQAYQAACAAGGP
jgi:DNA transformation protein and related proteins